MGLIYSAAPGMVHKNAKIEQQHGKPRDQAYAIAYNAQRTAAREQGKKPLPPPKKR
jgi:hypothetical protein